MLGARQRRFLVAALGAALLLAGAAGAGATEGAVEQELDVFKTITYVPSLDRDPFSLPAVAEAPTGGTKRNLDLRSARLVGLVRGVNELMALVEDERGECFTLRRGDKVAHGKVMEVSSKHLRAMIRIDGIGQEIRLEPVKEGD